MARFDGKIAVVTGAGQSLGLAVSEAFIKEGAKVIMIGRTASKIEAAAASLGESAIPYPMDVGVEQHWLDLVEYIKKNFGEIDYVINNAAVMKSENVFTTTLASFQDTMKTNLEGTFMSMKYMYEVMKKGCYSAFVNIASIGAHRSGPSNCYDIAYNASKGAVLQISKHCAYAYAPDRIKVNIVTPASIDSPMRAAYYAANPEYAKSAAERMPMPPHTTQPYEMAPAVLFCCDPACPTMTGAEILVDNGKFLQ